MLLKGKRDTLFIIVHGYKGSNEDYAIKNLSIELNKKDYSVFSPNIISEDIKGSETDIQSQVIQVDNAVNNFYGKYKRIILVGGSLGALVTKITAANNPHVNGLITLNGFFYFSGIKKDDLKTAARLFLTFPFNKDSRKTLLFYYKNLSSKKINIPTLIVTSKNDERISYKQSVKFFNSLRLKKKLVFIEGMDHGMTKKLYIINTVKEIVSWLNNL